MSTPPSAASAWQQAVFKVLKQGGVRQPMGRATQAALEPMGIHVMRVDDPERVEQVAGAGFDAAFQAGETVAVLLGQGRIGRKQWERR